MKTVEIGYETRKTVKFNVSELPKKWQEVLEAYVTKEEERTDKQWELVENHDLAEFLDEMGCTDDVYWGYVEIDSYE